MRSLPRGFTYQAIMLSKNNRIRIAVFVVQVFFITTSLFSQWTLGFDFSGITKQNTIFDHHNNETIVIFYQESENIEEWPERRDLQNRRTPYYGLRIAYRSNKNLFYTALRGDYVHQKQESQHGPIPIEIEYLSGQIVLGFERLHEVNSKMSLGYGGYAAISGQKYDIETGTVRFGGTSEPYAGSGFGNGKGYTIAASGSLHVELAPKISLVYTMSYGYAWGRSGYHLRSYANIDPVTGGFTSTDRSFRSPLPAGTYVSGDGKGFGIDYTAALALQFMLSKE